ncbi:MAG: methylglyoxal synthase [Candidatus Cloacimonadota bacterium]|nr:methylglyoxal synthase [Candidatus Cloacimonadota bacterium]RLC48508.1 MAG: methylglyoxal synthase [Candidatus Cloacimonadota bacterium]
MKTIALVAHDKQKVNMAEWANKNRAILGKYNLVGTEGTCETVNSVTGLNIDPLGHGPDGGDIVIANEVLQGNIDLIIFMIDVRTPHGHEHDIQTLLRICVLKNVPIALNKRSAELMFSSEMMKEKD